MAREDKNDNPRPRLGIGIGLVAVAALILASLVGYASSDPPGGDYVDHQPTANLCGLVGAYVAYYLFTWIGLAAYAVGSLALLWGVLLITGRAKGNVKLVLASSVLLVVALCTLLSTQLLNLPHIQNVSKTGGNFGWIVASAMVKLLAQLGALIVLVPVTVMALYFSTNGLAFRAVAAAGRWVGRLAASAGKGLAAFVRWMWHRADDADEPAPKARKRDKAKPAAVDVVPEPQEDVSEPEPPAPDLQIAPLPDSVIQEEPVAELPDTEPPAAKPHRKAAKKSKSSTGAEGKKKTDGEYELPSESLLDLPVSVDMSKYESFVREQAEKLQTVLRDFGVEARVVGVQTGPVITQYEISLAPGVKVQAVQNLSANLAMALKALSVRIVAPIPGRGTVGIEVPNVEKAVVRLRELLDGLGSLRKQPEIPLFLGRDAVGNSLYHDLAAMPHLLIAGCTGSGKSVCLNSVVMGILMTRTPEEVKLILIDPKMVELSAFAGIPHLMCPVVTDMKKASEVLGWAVRKMDERYTFLHRAGVKHVTSYNRLTREQINERFGIDESDEEEGHGIPYKLPYIIVIVDELADLMMVARKEVEDHVTRLAQKSRAVGIHVVLATQRPSVDVITGLIKSNLPSRISFQVAVMQDSRCILDRKGAELLLGQGDMLFLPPGTAHLIRAQGCYVSEDEIRRVIETVQVTGGEPEYHPELTASAKEADFNPREADDLYDRAVEIIVESGRGSVSLLQRGLGIGYTRASRLIDLMHTAGIVGDYKGSVAREVFMSPEELHALQESEAEG